MVMTMTTLTMAMVMVIELFYCLIELIFRQTQSCPR